MWVKQQCSLIKYTASYAPEEGVIFPNQCVGLNYYDFNKYPNGMSFELDKIIIASII